MSHQVLTGRLDGLTLKLSGSFLTGSLYEETDPEQLLQVRGGDAGAPREFLVKWADGAEDSWVGPCDC